MRTLLTLQFILFLSRLFCQNPGDSDKTFGNNGVTLTVVKQSSCITALGVQKNGAILAGGFSNGGPADRFLTVVQYDNYGRIDSSFASHGVFTFIPPGYRVERQNDLKIQSDGKILACGDLYGKTSPNYYGYNFGIYRLLPNGILDTTFNKTGIIIDYAHYKNSSSYVAGLALQKDDKIVIAGTCYNTAISDDIIFIARYHPDGSVDSSFNEVGMKTLQPEYYDGRCDLNKVLIQNDNKILILGKLNINGDFFIMRFNQDGEIDSTFGINGTVTYHIYTYMNSIYDAAITQDNKILIAGFTGNGDYSIGVIARYNENGTLDKTFNEDGLLIDNNCIFNSITLNSNGSFYSDCNLTLYDMNGIIDTTFGDNGSIETLCQHPKITLQRDGSILIGGGYDDHMRLERYHGYTQFYPYAANQTFYVYPNPFLNVINIKFEVPPTSPYEISINDILGNVVYSQTVTSLESIVSIQLNDLLLNNLYFVSVNNGSSVKSTTIIHMQ